MTRIQVGQTSEHVDEIVYDNAGPFCGDGKGRLDDKGDSNDLGARLERHGMGQVFTFIVSSTLLFSFIVSKYYDTMLVECPAYDLDKLLQSSYVYRSSKYCNHQTRNHTH
jgi:hypothetical protein